MHVGSLELDSQVVCLSWNNESNRMLVACESGSVQIWSYNPQSFEATKAGYNECTNNKSLTSKEPVQFSIYHEDHETTQEDQEEAEDDFDTNLFSSTNIFKKRWATRLANPAKCLKYSPDGSLFASFSEVDSFLLGL